MFDNIGRLAETAATHVSVSRRGFLGRLGQVALGAAGVVGGVSTLTGRVEARGNNLYLCEYGDRSTPRGCIGCGTNPLQICGGDCPTIRCCKLVSKTIIGTC
jgi:hypothetical protein